MPREDLTTGFFGKIPAAGDFVGRSLPAAYVRFWDRWIVHNLAAPLAADPWERHPALRFLLGPGVCGPMAGVVMASADRAGRRFPLTLAAPAPLAVAGLAAVADRWFGEIEEAGEAARCGELDADELGKRLAALPFPAADAGGEPVRGMAFWTDRSELYEVDPEAPRETLLHLLSAGYEVG